MECFSSWLPFDHLSYKPSVEAWQDVYIVYIFFLFFFVQIW
jgi:hypothetical protein